MKGSKEYVTVWYKLNSNKSRWKIFCVLEGDGYEDVQDQLHQVMSDLFTKYLGVADVRVTPRFLGEKSRERKAEPLPSIKDFPRVYRQA